MSIKSRFKQLGKDSVIYGIGGIIAKGIGFFLLPVYTRIFSPAEYGTIEMLMVLNQFLGALLVMGMDAAQSFYFFEQKQGGVKAQSRVVTAILQWRLSWGACIVLISTLASPLLSKFFFNDRLDWTYFGIAFLAALFTQILIQSAEVFRLQYRPIGYLTITLCQTLGSAALALTLILVFGFGVKGYFLGMLGGGFSAAVIGWWSVRAYVDFSKWHFDWWPRLLRFGSPLLPAALAMYVLRTSDRWFVGHYQGEEALGLYGVGARFAQIILAAVITFRRAWWPLAMDAMHSEDGPQLFKMIGRLYLGFGIMGIILLTALSPYLVKWFTAADYNSAYPIVGILAWYPVFFGFYLLTAAGIWKKEQTKIAPFLSGFAALLNVGLDFLLVPNFGGIGAATATAISFGVWNMATLMVSERLWKVWHNFFIFLVQILIGVIVCALILISYKNNVNILNIAVLTIFGMLSMAALSAKREHIRKGISLIMDKIK